MPPKKRACKLSQKESDDPEINTDMCCVCTQKIAQGKTGVSVHVAAGYMDSVPMNVF